MTPVPTDVMPRSLTSLPPAQVENTPEFDIAEAEDFIRQHHAEYPDLGPVEARLAEVHAEIAATGTYRHTTAELTFGARVAWRNSSRCIGRLYWRSLKVRDQREVSAPADVAADLSLIHI